MCEINKCVRLRNVIMPKTARFDDLHRCLREGMEGGITTGEIGHQKGQTRATASPHSHQKRQNHSRGIGHTTKQHTIHSSHCTPHPTPLSNPPLKQTRPKPPTSWLSTGTCHNDSISHKITSIYPAVDTKPRDTPHTVFHSKIPN